MGGFFFLVEQYLDNLKCLDLRYSEDLIETPDFTGVPRLERLHLSWCNNLVDIHPSIGQLSRLIVLDLEYCVSLINLPSMSSEMESLKILKLCGCSKIRKIPEFKGIMRSLSELHLDKTAIKKLPSSIERLTALTLLSLRDCQYLTCLPRNKDSLRSLEKLDVIGCSKLNDVPEHLRSIKCLEHDLSRTGFDRNVSVRCRSLSPTFKRIGHPSQCLKGFAFDVSYSQEFDLGETFGLKALVIAPGDMPHCYYATEISCSTKLVARHIWLLYLPRDDWFATARSGEFNQIEVVFESSRPGLYVRKCGLSLVYKQDVEMFTRMICSSNRITFEGSDGSHDEFDNLWRHCDEYNDNEPSAIRSPFEEIESYISSVNGNDLIKHPYVTY